MLHFEDLLMEGEVIPTDDGVGCQPQPRIPISSRETKGYIGIGREGGTVPLYNVIGLILHMLQS